VLFKYITKNNLSQDNSVSIAMGYRLDARVRFPTGPRDSSLFHSIQTSSGAHSASYSMGTGCSFPGVKRPGCEADHSLPSNAEVKNELCHTLPYIFISWWLINYAQGKLLPLHLLRTITNIRKMAKK
jgi:hypothetical protein